ncbi:hypothetical protein Raf01_93440 [Rugosimonospora africana]|uniref:Uncharacterized protein n=1 Tax=Rugosimonospora africana TaxID=556532 RepID=A0A8J3R3F6_9ACTN|nr:hypothetical protein Raf01_93440 [Rugosimonospora africana]
MTGNNHISAPGPRITEQYKKLLAHIERAKIEITLNKKGEHKGVRSEQVAPRVSAPPFHARPPWHLPRFTPIFGLNLSVRTVVL